MLSKQDILTANDRPVLRVAVPEWGGDVYVRMLSAAERDAFEASRLASRTKDRTVNLRNFRGALAALCLCDEQGVRLFEDSDAELLGGKGAAPLDRVFEAAMRHNRMSDDDVEAAVKN